MRGRFYHWQNAGLKLFYSESKCKFTLKEVAAQLSPLLVLTYAYFLDNCFDF